MTRLKEVAARAGVSIATTSRVLSGKDYVSGELRERVLVAVDELNYSPNGIARSMSQRRTLTIGLVVSDITNPFFTLMARGVEDTGQKSGYSVVLANTDEDLDRERSSLDVLRQKRVDGILLTVSSTETAHVRRLIDAGIKIVLIDRSLPDLAVPSVQVNNVGGVREAMAYLLALGHQRIGIITGNLSESTGAERLAGYEVALAAAGMPLDRDLVVSGHFKESGGYAAAQRLWSVSDRATALISCNNAMTTGVLLALRERGARVPDDVSVVGFDDIPYYALLDRPLTAIAQPTYELGCQACALLLHLIADNNDDRLNVETKVRLPTTFIVRASCRPYSGPLYT